MQAPLSRLAARYLVHGKHARNHHLPRDPVARFHLGNGARIERVNPLGDVTPKGFSQSFGLMVNYRYDPDKLEDNVEAFAADGHIAATSAVTRLARLPTPEKPAT